MFEDEIDSDDDFEGYFLKPVNEYNIVDKIKEANKELFSTPQPPSPSASGVQRKVTFRAVLEDYEPCEQYAVEIEISSVTTKEGYTYDIHSEPEEKEKIQRPVPVVECASDPRQNDSIYDVENDYESKEITEELFNLHIDKTEVKITENEESSISSAEVTIVDFECDKNDSFRKIELPHLLESIDDSSQSSSDDDLSVIVASYIIDDPKKKFSSDDDDIKPLDKKKIKKSFKPNCKKNNSKKSENSDVLKIKLNYKTCCEYKNATNEQLPKYMGYLSTYGLSKEQWDRREKLLEKKEKNLLETNLRVSTEGSKKIEDNEKAFINWLRHKMKCPINKAKNMFDFKSKPRKSKVFTKST